MKRRNQAFLPALYDEQPVLILRRVVKETLESILNGHVSQSYTKGVDIALAVFRLVASRA